MHRVDAFGNSPECVGSSPRVSGVCQDGAKEFAKRRSRLAERLSAVAEKLAGSRDESSRETRREIARKKTRGRAARLPEVGGVCGSEPPVPQITGGGQRLTMGKPPRTVGKSLVPHFS
ncbi:hypothetical protein BHM03_00024873, partial [Ensete ventricosum]